MPTSLSTRLIRLSRNPVAQWAAVAGVCGLILGVLGPFGSYLNTGLEKRITYWVVSMLVGAALFGGTLRAVKRVAPGGGAKTLSLLAVALGLVSVLQAFLTRTAAFWLWPELHRFDLSPVQWYGQTLLIGGLMFLTVWALQRRAASRPVLSETAPPAALPTDVLALQMEDHYVRVHTPAGAQLMLMPLHQAIAQLETEGLRTHRSWWVARHAVKTIEGTPRAMRLHLTNGLTAPVARSAVVHLRQAGWLS
ncbi:LytTR family DNA-binding domain-containing protein [Asticcacaulis excentricus]|uniref:Response regulator receiver protein n=1 Tax=Asticcacaulis excentricus (strain ATCC 15261 / DSM 4724 / KCTC 12464 / NCIMB 9791 / VKM B-1370 / CB 48) TaxID=573065 RepID=E8RRE2_ASTEC|nr:LytTR family DNA-binding domain-containing protein [Asticcacaulis excentricus]ADU12333.1 response regulator receiver protein [Asticcacaulis excentricus CB 48]